MRVPVFQLDGPLTGPITIYYDGDSTLVYSDDVAAGLNNRVVIDTRFTRAFLVFQQIDVTAALSGRVAAALPLGTTEITVTTGSPLDTGTVTICWDNAVISA